MSSCRYCGEKFFSFLGKQHEQSCPMKGEKEGVAGGTSSVASVAAVKKNVTGVFQVKSQRMIQKNTDFSSCKFCGRPVVDYRLSIHEKTCTKRAKPRKRNHINEATSIPQKNVKVDTSLENRYDTNTTFENQKNITNLKEDSYNLMRQGKHISNTDIQRIPNHTPKYLTPAETFNVEVPEKSSDLLPRPPSLKAEAQKKQIPLIASLRNLQLERYKTFIIERKPPSGGREHSKHARPRVVNTKNKLMKDIEDEYQSEPELKRASYAKERDQLLSQLEKMDTHFMSERDRQAEMARQKLSIVRKVKLQAAAIMLESAAKQREASDDRLATERQRQEQLTKQRLEILQKLKTSKQANDPEGSFYSKASDGSFYAGSTRLGNHVEEDGDSTVSDMSL